MPADPEKKGWRAGLGTLAEPERTGRRVVMFHGGAWWRIMYHEFNPHN